MDWIAKALVLFVAIEHFFFMYLETLAWTKPLGKKVFRLSDERAETTASLAVNQGWYNGFLAAGLLWALFRWSTTGVEFAAFFLSCVVVAGIVGAATVNKRIFFVQSTPALVGLIVLFLA